MRAAKLASPGVTAGVAGMMAGIVAISAGCATSGPARAPGSSPGALAGSAPPASSVPTFRCGPRDREWELWSRQTFGASVAVLQDGPDPAPLLNLTGEAKTRAETMLRRGLAACDLLALEAVERAGWRGFIPELTRAVGAESSNFRVHALLALKALGSPDDFTDTLIATLNADSEEARITAAIGARQFSLDRVRAPLLERVRLDRSSLVRYHAIESLLDLADIYPRDLSEHPSIAAALAPVGKIPPTLNPSGSEQAPEPDALARQAEAARQLDAAVTERLAAGPCSKVVTLAGIPLHVLRVQANANDRVVALAAEDRIGSCERTLGFVAFLYSAEGFAKWVESGASGKKDPVHMSISARPTPVPVEYRRASRTLTVGSLALDLAKGNVVVLSADRKGVVSRHQSTRSLSFERHGRPPPAAVDFLRFEPEIASEVRTLLESSPELRELIGAPAKDTGGTR